MSNLTSSDINVNANTYNGGPRTEIKNLTLEVTHGTLPADLSGVAFFGSMCGSVNSGGLPFKKELADGAPNHEFGTPFINGDGMVFSIDMNSPGTVQVNSRLMKTPCYYADEATRINGPADKKKYPFFEFKNLGLSRMSLLLGSRNYVNTTVTPIAFDNDSSPSLLATIDNGRPYKLNPATLELVTPVGYNTEWNSALPPFLKLPFPMFETSAHPSFDPVTKELFSVNYTQSSQTESSRSFLHDFLHHDNASLESQLTDIATRHQEHGNNERSIGELHEMVENFRKTRSKHEGFLSKAIAFVKNVLSNEKNKATETIDQVFLIRFNNKGAFKKWRLTDPEGNDLKISQCMHQTGISKNYILLMNSSFKFAFELLINNPFPHIKIIDRFIRLITSKSMLSTTEMWIVDRRDLNDNVESIKTIKLKNNIPYECLHFSAEYDDTDDQVTIFTAHNNAACFAEWLRPYDINFFTKEAYPDTLVGDFATGEMSVGALGKFVIDARSGETVQEKFIREIGDQLPPVDRIPPGDKPFDKVGPNTWGIGLYTFRDIISPTVPNTRIKRMYFINYGANPMYLTQWIHDLYVDYKNREIPVHDFLAYTKKGIPPSLIAIDTEKMEIVDYFQFDMNAHPMSIQFIPRKERSSDIPPEADGYLIFTTKSPVVHGDELEYVSELWIMDANNIQQGPVCVLGHKDFQFCFTTHCSWLEAAENLKSGYQVDIIKDLQQTIDASMLSFEDKKYTEFFNEFVYPHFKS